MKANSLPLLIRSLLISVFVFAVASENYAEVRYYGYYHTSTAFGNGVKEVAEFTNLNHMYGTRENLELCRETGTQALVSARWQFFLETGLRQDWKLHWRLLAQEIRPFLDHVGGFYVADEPYWRGITFDELEFAVSKIKQTFPEKPVMTTLAWPMVTNGLALPPNLDWVGFDRYGDINAIAPLLETLKPSLADHQRVFLVPDGMLKDRTDAELAEVNRQYHALAESDPLVIGELVFHWSVARELPLTYETQREIGSGVVRRQPRELMIRIEPPEAGEAIGAGFYPRNTTVHVEALPNEGFEFLNWSGASVLSPTAPKTSLALKENTILTAHFNTATFGKNGVPIQSWGVEPAAPGASFVITWDTSPGLTYLIEASDSLSKLQWVKAGQIQGDGSVHSWTDPVPEAEEKYYRVRRQ